MDVTIEDFRELLKVRYYTIRLENAIETETDAFYARFRNSPDRKERRDFDVIHSWLRKIGTERGAFPEDDFFRGERAARALPPVFASGNRLRLYCIVCSEDVVILGGGGRKEEHEREAKTALDVAYHFTVMNDVAKVLRDRIRRGTVTVEPKALVGDFRRLVLPNL